MTATMRMGWGLLLAATLCVSACSSRSDAPAKAPAPQSVPASSPLAKIQVGMTDSDVRATLGAPDRTKSYPNWKRWIPFYWGPDTSRAEWQYEGQGLITFSRNRYTGGFKVIRVIYKPDI